jgi:hypothetical protein
MQWFLESDAKPEKWKLVMVYLEGRAGDLLEKEALCVALPCFVPSGSRLSTTGVPSTSEHTERLS